MSKANEIVQSLAQRPNADELFIEMLNDVHYFSGEGDRRRQDATSFKPLLVALMKKHFTFSSPQISVTTVTSAVRTSMKKVGDGRSIFIVHGRNTAARDELAKFLKHLHTP